jgi:hypothetical protein
MKYKYLSIKVPIHDGIKGRETLSTEDCHRLKKWAKYKDVSLGRFIGKVLRDKLDNK